MVSLSIQPISLVTGCNVKSAIVLPTNLCMDTSVKIISWSRNTSKPVIGEPTFIEPAPFATEKSLSVYGAVKLSIVPLPKNKAFLKLDINDAPFTSAGASFNAVNILVSYVAGAFAPSTNAIFCVPLKLYFANLVLLAPSLLVDINVNAALSAGLDASAGSILKVAPPEDTVAVAVTV